MVNEYSLDLYRERNLHKSVTGAATNDLEFPAKAYTIELGESNFTGSENVGIGIRCILRIAAKLGIIDAKNISQEILKDETSKIATLKDNLNFNSYYQSL